MLLTEKTIKANTVYSGSIINVRCDDALLSNGKPCTREVVEHPGGVCVAALTDENELIFVRQYRYPYSKEVLELPAGKLEYGEDPFEAGKRELQEETGAVAGKYIDFGIFYPTPGYCGEIIYLYAASELTFIGQNLDEDEFLNVEKIHIDKAVEMVMAGEIPDGKTQVLVLKMARMLGRQ